MKRFSVIFCLCFGVLLSILSGCERVTPPMLPEGSAPEMQPLTVMTYNVYLGSSVNPVLSVENLLQVPTAVANVYNNIQVSDFPGRATAIAASIKADQPHLIGLQEIALIRRQSPGDRIAGGTLPATEVVIDYLEILMDALDAEGLDYHVAAKVENVDVEMPMFTETGVDDVRLTDYDVILARGDVQTAAATAGTYNNAVTVEMLQLSVPRGYVAVDASVAGRTYRVVNTHLEAFDEAVRVAQTQQLIDSLADETLPIILLGDFNTAAPDGTAYQMLLAAEYIDVWQPDADAMGNTCCQVGDLRNEMSAHRKRIDLIFVRNHEGEVSAITHTVGDKPSDRLPSGVWPSDHAGVVAVIDFSIP